MTPATPGPEAGPYFGRLLVLAGLLLLAVGLFLMFGGRVFRLGRLPGDIVLGGRNFRLFIPITTSLILSFLLTLILALVSILRR